MSYPELPFANYNWRMSHHWGKITPEIFYQLLRAADMHQGNRDAAQDINTYLITSKVLPANIRSDTGQPEIWRDYQQVLTQIGVMFPTRGGRVISFTQAGLAFLDGAITFTDLLDIQAFRWQYPNGHNSQNTAGERSDGFDDLQAASGARVRPAVLLWQILENLHIRGESAHLTSGEIENFAVPALTHSDLANSVSALLSHRRSGNSLPKASKRRRDAAELIKFLSHTTVFARREKALEISKAALSNMSAVSAWMLEQAQDDKLWRAPDIGSAKDSWFNWYGTLPSTAVPSTKETEDYGHAREPDSPLLEIRKIHLREFDPLEEKRKLSGPATITATYSAELSESQHRQHDAMVSLIARACRAKKATVLCDPATLDLLIQINDWELLVEVKSASARNLADKIRSAVGQITYYDFLRSKESAFARRRAVALTVDLEDGHWVNDYLGNFLDIDLITLRNGVLQVTSHSGAMRELFST